MKSLRLQATKLSLGFLVLAGAFVGFAGVADAATTTCTNQCVGGYETQSYSCVTDSGTACSSTSFYWGGGCGYGAGTYGPGCYPYTCYGTCTQQVWNSCLSTTQVCTTTYASCSGSGTLSWGAGCSATGSYSAPNGGSATADNSASGYTGSITYSCSDGAWVGPTSSSCTSCTSTGTFDCAPVAGTYGVPVGATGTGTYSYNSCTGAITYTGGCTVPVKAPTSASVSASPNPAYLTGTVGISWSGNNAPTSYNVTVGGTTYPVGALTSWSGLVTDLISTIGTYPLGVQACNTAGCASGSGSLTVSGPKINTFSASTATLPKGGGTVTLTWDSAGAKTCTASNALGSGNWSGPVSISGTMTVSTTDTNTYYLTCN